VPQQIVTSRDDESVCTPENASPDLHPCSVARVTTGSSHRPDLAITARRMLPLARSTTTLRDRSRACRGQAPMRNRWYGRWPICDARSVQGCRFLASSALGLVGPHRTWVWALCARLGIPLVSIISSHNFGSILALGFASAGAYAGLPSARSSLLRSSESALSRPPGTPARAGGLAPTEDAQAMVRTCAARPLRTTGLHRGPGHATNGYASR
jgi:hypothetical protein